MKLPPSLLLRSLNASKRVVQEPPEAQHESGSVASATYRNPWYSSAHGHDPEFYTTTTTPVERNGCLIYNRIKGEPGRGVWDVVLNGVCIAQFAGPNCIPHSGPQVESKDATYPGGYRQWLIDIGALPEDDTTVITSSPVDKL